MTLITRISPLTKIKKIELNLDNIKYIINDGSSYYIARKRGRNSFFLNSFFYEYTLKFFDGYNDDDFKSPGYSYLLNDGNFFQYLKDNCAMYERENGDYIFYPKRTSNF